MINMVTKIFTAYNSPYLTIYTENSIFIYDAFSGEWVQSMPLKKSRSLTRDGSLILTTISDQPVLAYLQNIKHGMYALLFNLKIYF